MQLLPNGKAQWIDANGAPLANGTVGYYVPATLTPKTTYQDQAGTIPNANPISLDSRGQAIVWGSGTYRQIVKDASGVTIWDQIVSDSISDLQSGAPFYLAAASGSDAITGSVTPALTSYGVGRYFWLVPAATNTTATPTLNINGVGVRSIKKNGSAPLSPGDLQAGIPALLFDDGTQFQLVISGAPQAAPIGQCRLAKSGANIVLSPFMGNKITINGTAQTIPSAGVSLVPTGLTAGTLYYVYVYMNSGVMTLEASTTGHATDANTGVEIKSGDATRTLVGMVRPIAGPAFSDTGAQRFVATFFNRRSVNLANALGGDTAISSTTVAELVTTLRCEFLCWADETNEFSISGYASNNNAGALTNTFIGIDSGTSTFNRSVLTSGAASQIGPVNVEFKSPLSEGYHFATLNSSVSAGTSTYYSAASQLISGIIRA